MLVAQNCLCLNGFRAAATRAVQIHCHRLGQDQLARTGRGVPAADIQHRKGCGVGMQQIYFHGIQQLQMGQALRQVGNGQQLRGLQGISPGSVRRSITAASSGAPFWVRYCCTARPLVALPR